MKALLGFLGAQRAAAALLQEGGGGAWTGSIETLRGCGQTLKAGQVGREGVDSCHYDIRCCPLV